MEHGNSSKQLPSAFSLFKPSWRAIWLNFWTFVLAFLIPVLFIALPAVLFAASFSIRDRVGLQNPQATTSAVNIAAVVLGVIGVLLILFLFTPLLYLLKLESAKGNKVSLWPTFKRSLKYFWRMLGLLIIRNLLIAFGFILLIVPGLYMWKKYMLAPFYLIDMDSRIGEAMNQSAADSKPFSSAIWGMIGVYVLLAVISAVTGVIPFLGILGTIPSIIFGCAQALRYLQVQDAK